MRVSLSCKFVFVSTPKACTHSIYEILDRHYAHRLYKFGFHNTKIPKKFQSFFRWTVCRNPFSRAVSLWWSACRCHEPDRYGFREGCGSSDDFKRFVVWLADVSLEDRAAEPLTMNQSEWLSSVEPIVAVHAENLEEELQGLPFWKYGIKVPQLNTTEQKIADQEAVEGRPIERPPWQDMYKDEKAREAVLEWAGPDFERFEYPTEIS